MFGKKRRLTPSLKDSMQKLERRMESMQMSLDTLRYDNIFVQKELDKHLDAAGGGFWKTAKGHLIRIRDMSTDHIKRCLAGNFAKRGGKARSTMKCELDRREKEDYWRALPMPGEEDTDGLHSAGLPDYAGTQCVGKLFGANIHVDFNTPENMKQAIRRFFEQWNYARQARRDL